MSTTQKIMQKSYRGASFKGFLDCLRLRLVGGSGGEGYNKIGGIGGKGGDIILKGSEGQNLSRLKRLNPICIHHAGNGDPSRQHHILGFPGSFKTLEVPLGVTIETDNGKYIGEIVKEGQQVLAARGGAGGCLDNRYIGQPGEDHYVRILLSVIADIGLVGFPNAGKSTFLRRISHAKPKVANYPFTTLNPMVGEMKYEDHRKITVADLPGLIEGAWMNKGFGHSFLRHVERTKMLLFVVDIFGFQLSPAYQHRSALETIILLNKEIELYQRNLTEKPCTLLLNKMDLPGSKAKLLEIEKGLENLQEEALKLPEEMRPEYPVTFTDVIPISAKCDPKTVDRVKEKLRHLVDVNAPIGKSEEEIEEQLNFDLEVQNPKLS